MSLKFGRTAAATLVGTLLLASPFADAATPTPKPEKSLLGVRLMSTFKDVLKKFGQPDEIQIGSPVMPEKADLGATQANAAPGFGGMAAPAGGAARRGGMMGGSMGGGMSMPPGMMGGGGSMGGGMPNYGAMAGMMRPGGSMGGMGGGSMGGRLPGFAGGGRAARDSSGDGLPSFPGGSMGGMAGGMPGAPGAGMDGAAEEGAGESTWWYHVKGSKGQNIGLHYSFLFNKEGKVIQIQQYGYSGGGKTAQGLGLGSTLGQVLNKYGMSNEGGRTGELAQMSYGSNGQVVFQLLKNRVIGVTLAVTK